MCLYQNYIIANSSLSWWAAVVSTANHKKVLIQKNGINLIIHQNLK